MPQRGEELFKEIPPERRQFAEFEGAVAARSPEGARDRVLIKFDCVDGKTGARAPIGLRLSKDHALALIGRVALALANLEWRDKK